MMSCSPPPGIASCNVGQVHMCVELYSTTAAQNFQQGCAQLGGAFVGAPCPSGAVALCSVISGQDLESVYGYDSSTFTEANCMQEKGMWCPL
jgi:hypothetical protein